METRAAPRQRARRRPRRRARPLPDRVPRPGLAERRRSAGPPAGGVRPRQLHRPRPLRAHLRQHLARRGDRHGVRGALRLHDGLDPLAHQRARPRGVRAAHGDAVLRDPAHGGPGLGAHRLAEQRVRQSGLASARGRRLRGRHQHARGHRVGHGAVRGLRSLRDDRRRDEVDGPGDGRSLADPRRRPGSHDAAHHLAARPAGRARRGHLRLRRDARLVLRGTGAGAPRPLLRRDHRHVPDGVAVSAAFPDRGGDGRLALRRHVRDGVALPPHRERRDLRHHHRQGLPAPRHGRRRVCAGRSWACASPISPSP